MRFRFVSGLEVPDWILAHVANFNELDTKEFEVLCRQVAEKIPSTSPFSWAKSDVNPQIPTRSSKALLSALSFIMEKARKSRCSPSDLEKEMLQIGFNTEYAKILKSAYPEELINRSVDLSIKAPSFQITNSRKGPNGQLKLDIFTSSNESLSLTTENPEILLKSLETALTIFESYSTEDQT